MAIRHLAIGLLLICWWLSLSTDLPAQSDGATAQRSAAWTSSRIAGTPDKPLPLTIEPAFKHLKFTDPMQMRWQADVERYFVCELGAKIWSFRHDEEATQADLVVDLKSSMKNFDPAKTRGCDNVYSIAFDPDFQTNRFIYVCMIFNSIDARPYPEGSRVSRFEVSRTEPPTIDVNTEVPIIKWLVGGHNGCDLVFDNSGCLLISTGDATSPVPPDGLNTGQDCSDLLASILRIDVRGATIDKPYRIPGDNPFVDKPGARPEIWAFGLRNPWRITVDRPTGQLWLGDVGWEKWEMVHRIVRGGNYGWAVREGHELLQPNAPIGPAPILPARVAMSHADSASVTGGFVYRGSRLKEILGQYIFGDWVNGRIWSVPLDDHSPHTEVASGQLRIIAFEPDRDGEPLIVNHLENTTMFRLVRNTNYENELAAAQNFPTRLSETGIFADVASQKPAAGVRQFSINQPQWQDGATGAHFLAVPGTEPVTVYRDPQPVGVLAMFNSRLQYPAGTVLAKTLTMPASTTGQRPVDVKLETQVLHFDGRLWRGYSYAWNQEQTDAMLVEAGGSEIIVPGADAQRWRIHSRTECMQCHNPWPETTLAFSPEQLHRPDMGQRSEWLKLVSEGWVVTKESADKSIDPAQCVRVSLHADESDAALQARAYLHVNCSHCHQNGAGAGVPLNLRIQETAEAMQAIEKVPMKGDFGIQQSRIIAAGSPSRSALFYRMASSSAGRMPHIGSREVDYAALKFIGKWIKSLDRVVAKKESDRETADLELMNQLVKQTAAAETSDSPEARSQRLKAALNLTMRYATVATRDKSSEMDQGLQTLARSKDPLISSLFEGHLPAKLRQRRLSPGAQYAEIADLAGDAQRGQAYFMDQTRSQCSKCHRVGQQGGQVGPAMDDIGRRQSATQIFESLVDPSRVIDPKYQSHMVIRTDGQVVTGLLASETEEELVLINSQGEKIKLDSKEIDSRKIDSKSLMPSGLVAEMTAQQAADLVAYLLTLKGANPAAATSSTSQKLRIDTTADTLTVSQGEHPILVYNIQSPPAPEGIDKVYERSGFMHPVYTPSGQVLTAAFPVDHAHQHGIFTAWVKTSYRDKPVDFWNLAGKTGRVVHEQLVSTNQNEDGSVSFEVNLLHRALLDQPVDVLQERWQVTVQPTDGTYYCFDLQTTQTALTDDPLVVEKYHYGGVAFRGNVRWLWPEDGASKQVSDSQEANDITNSLGQDRIAGNHAHAKWVAISGKLSEQPSTLAMLDHPSNFRSPQPARLHPTKPYFVYAPCVDGEFKIDKQHPYQARYRFLVTDKPLDRAWVDQKWSQWAK